MTLSSPGEKDLILLRQVTRALVTVEARDVSRVDDGVHQVTQLLWKSKLSEKYILTLFYWPWTESTLSWNPWDTALGPDLNSTQRLLLCPENEGHVTLLTLAGYWPVRMTGCLVEEQLENTELAWPWSDRDTVSEAEQSGGRDSLNIISLLIVHREQIIWTRASLNGQFRYFSCQRGGRDTGILGLPW